MSLGPVQLGPNAELGEEQVERYYASSIFFAIYIPVAWLLGLVLGRGAGLLIGIGVAFVLTLLHGSLRVEHRNLINECSIAAVFGELIVLLLYLDIFDGARIPWTWYVVVVPVFLYGLTAAVPTIRAWRDWMDRRETTERSAVE